MMRFKNIWQEINKFGWKEVFFHIFSILTKRIWEKTQHGFCSYTWFHTHMLIERDKYYRNLDNIGIKTEIEQQYTYIMQEEIDIDHPVNFSQRIQWLKVYDNQPIKQTLSDKYEVRQWVADKIGEQYLIPLLGVWSSFEEMDIKSLPEAFVLKSTNGSKMNYIVKDKSTIDWKKMKKLVDLWLKCPFYAKCLELQYKDMKTKFLAEEYIGQKDKILFSYSFYCFHGEPKLVGAFGQNDTTLKAGNYMYYDLNWKRKVEYEKKDGETYSNEFVKPQNLDEMIIIARKLSVGFEYVRVDLYDVNGEIKFSEMTFTPGAGYASAKWMQQIPNDWWK